MTVHIEWVDVDQDLHAEDHVDARNALTRAGRILCDFPDEVELVKVWLHGDRNMPTGVTHWNHAQRWEAYVGGDLPALFDGADAAPVSGS